MSERYLLGVDGGGTKTHCVLYGLEDDDCSLFTFPCSNHEKLGGGYKELEKVLDEIVSISCDSKCISPADIVYACFTLSGIDFPYQSKLISEMIENTGLRDYLLRNDAFAGIKANCEHGYGIAAVNGTGCCIAGINERGESAHVGGLGGFSGDIGGGHQMITDAVSAVYDYLFRDGEKTVLTTVLAKALGTSASLVPEKAFQAFENRDDETIRKMSIAVYEAVDRGDRTALDILERIGDYYVENIVAVYKRLSFTSSIIPVALIGTQFVKGENPAIINRIRHRFELGNLPFEIVRNEAIPVAGSVLWAADMIGITGEHRQRIKNNLTKLK
jgi:N-acetylglucosamine kinase-like BadF-type ATPase